MRIKLGFPLDTKMLSERFPNETLLFSTTTATHLTTDSRETVTGDIFVALDGKSDSGTRFIGDARNNGASLALFGNARSTLLTLAKEARKKLKGRVIAVTGSVGKTTTKDLLSAILSVRGKVFATHQNENNELGVPLTVLSAPKDTDFLIVEMGMRHSGEIASLSKAVLPDDALITAVGQSHIETLGSISEVRRAKYEILCGLKPEGSLFTGISATPPEETILPKKTVSLSKHTPPFVYGIAPTDTGTLFSIALCDRNIENLFISAYGRHTARNAALASLLALSYGLTEAELREGLSRYRGSALRTEIQEKNGVFLLMDCYNASPESMAAAAETVKDFIVRNSAKRFFALLGDMNELGKDASALHIAVGEIFGRLTLTGIFAFGSHRNELLSGAKMTGFAGILSDDLALLSKTLQKGDFLLVKASRSLGGERMAEQLFKTKEDL